MAWTDFWEMLDGRVWIEMVRAGKSAKRELSAKELVDIRDDLRQLAQLKGWING